MAISVIEKYMNELEVGVENPVEFCDPTIIKPFGERDNLSAYRECAEKKGLMDVVFTYADKTGDLSTMDENGVAIVLPHTSLEQDLDYYQAWYKDSFLAKEFTVRIDRIDEEDETVYVRSARTAHASTRNRISREIQDRLNKGEMVHIKGRPTRIDPNCVYVNILGKGILGMCMVSNWQKGYTKYLQNECTKDAIYDFVITGRLKPVPGRAAAYALSRIPFTTDPWEKVNDIHEGDVMVVRCGAKPEFKSYFWGNSDMVKGIDIMCDYNDKISIMAGGNYKCRVKEADAANHVLKVVPFAVADSTVFDRDIVRFIEAKRRTASRSRR